MSRALSFQNHCQIGDRVYKRYINHPYLEVPRTTAFDRNRRGQRNNVDNIVLPVINRIENITAENVENNSNANEDNIQDEMYDCPRNSAECHNSDNDSNSSDEYNLNVSEEDYTDNCEGIIQHELLENPIFHREDDPDLERNLLYENCKITLEESELLILSFLARHGYTDTALEDLIDLINFHTPVKVLPSKYLLLKNFRSEIPIQKRFFCPDCNNILRYNTQETSTCETCTKNFCNSNLKQKYNYFVTLPLEPQLRNIVTSKLFYSLRKACNSESDVISGNVYRQLIHKGIIGQHDLTLQFNTDGAKTCQSARKTLWPLYVSINELRFKERSQNVLLAGIWYGPTKPDMTIFLKFLVEELNALHSIGFQCVTPDGDEVLVKVHTIASPVDSQARPMLQNIMQYNGKYGCSFCLHPGEIIEVGRGTARVYRGPAQEPRTVAQHRRDSVEAYDRGEAVNGVHGPALLALLSVFNIILSFVPEYMHAVLLGIVKTIVCALFDPSNRDKEWYLGGKVQLFDEKLKRIKPCSEITRTPRSITDRVLWKASEWKNFLLYYSLSCFDGILPEKYLRHWLLLVLGISRLLKTKISENDVEKARQLLFKFVSQIEKLYGAQYNTFNAHLLLHICDAVKNFGALWACSAFVFETYNGIIVSLIKSRSNNVLEQICKQYLRSRMVEKRAKIVFSQGNCNQSAKEFYLKWSKNLRVSKKCVQFGPYLRTFGKAVETNLDVITKLAIEQALNVGIINTAKKYKRFIYQNVLYHSIKYERLEKRNNSTIEVNNHTYVEILEIYSVTTETEELKNIIVGKLFERLHDREIMSDRSLLVSSNEVSPIFNETNNVIAFWPSAITKKCIKIGLSDDEICIVPLVNFVERD